MDRRHFLSGVGSVALVGCAPAAVPDPNAAHWREATTDHLTLSFSVSADEARQLALLIEAIYQSIHDLGFPTAKTDGHVWVVVARGAKEYEAVLGKHTAGQFHGPRVGSRYARKPAIAVMLTAGAGFRNVLAHELTHYLVHLAYGDGVPAWLNEGLAQYWSTIDVKDGVATLGGKFTEREVDDGHLRPGRRPNPPIPLAELVPPSVLVKTDDHDVEGNQSDDPAARRHIVSLYLSSYLFVHLMMNGPEEYRLRGQAFLKKLEGGMTLVSSAYSAAFGDKAPAVLDADFLAWAKLRARPAVSHPYELRPRAIVSERLLDRSDVALLGAMLAGR